MDNKQFTLLFARRKLGPIRSILLPELMPGHASLVNENVSRPWGGAQTIRWYAAGGHVKWRLLELAYCFGEDFGVLVYVGCGGGWTHQGHVVEWS